MSALPSIRQRSEQKGREAAETIASDLSGRLQAAKAEYHTLALTNRKLAKKVKKLRQRLGVEVSERDGERGRGWEKQEREVRTCREDGRKREMENV